MTLTDTLRAALAERHPGKTVNTVGDMLANRLISKALGGHLGAMRLIFDRLDGPAGGAIRADSAATLHREAQLGYGYAPGGFQAPEIDEPEYKQSER